jgi:hypothetical protein
MRHAYRSGWYALGAKADQVKASFKNGGLEVRMPKTEEAKKNAITVTFDLKPGKGRGDPLRPHGATGAS